jgi:hypothetical protein
MITLFAALGIGWLLVECGYYLGWTRMRAQMCDMLDYIERRGGLDPGVVHDYLRKTRK